MPAEALQPATEERLSLDRAGRLGDFRLSMDGPEALGFLLEVLYPPHGRRERWRLRWGRLLPWPLNARWSLEEKPEDAGADLPLLQELSRKPGLLEKAVPGSSRLAWVASANRGREESGPFERVFLVRAGDAEAAAVLELHRAEASAACTDEADALRWLAGNLPVPLAERVPAVRFHCVRDGLEALCLTALPGASAYVEACWRRNSRSLAIRHLGAAADWLVPFQRETRTGDPWELPEWSFLTGGLDVASEPPPWWAPLTARLGRRSLPRVARHGDFWARNLLPGPEGAGPAVVDWGALRTNASPLDDLFDFALTYGELLAGPGGGDGTTGFLRAFGRGSHPGPQVWAYVRQVLAGLGVELGIEHQLLAVYLLDRARHAGLGAPGRLGRDRPASFWTECYRRWRP